MKISTTLFGEVELDPSKIITFESTIPAFPDSTQYAIIHDEESPESIFAWLQSVTEPDVLFIMADIALVIPDYAPRLNQNELNSLAPEGNENFVLYCIANVPDTLEDTSVNLKAPIVINLDTQKGKQLIAENEEYDLKYKIFGK